MPSPLALTDPDNFKAALLVNYSNDDVTIRWNLNRHTLEGGREKYGSLNHWGETIIHFAVVKR
jgi:hypothetical protein